MPSRSAAFAPEHDGRVLRRRRVEERALRAPCRRPRPAARARWPRTPMPPVSDGEILSVRRTDALDARRARRRDHRADAPDHGRGVLGQLRVVAEERLARPGTVSRFVPSASSWASRSARPDAEMPSTATSAAMPMAMPRAVSAVRSRRVRSPTAPARSTSRGAAGSAAASGPAPAASGRRHEHVRHPATATRLVVADDPPVEQRHAPGERVGQRRSWVMSTMVEPAAVQVVEGAHDLGAGVAVEVAGGLVGQHQRRLADDGPGDGHPLALAARQLSRAGGPCGGARPTRSSAVRARARRRRSGSPAYISPTATFSTAVSPSMRLNCWNTKPMWRLRSADSAGSRRRAMSWPAMRTVPDVGHVERADRGSAACSCPTPTARRWRRTRPRARRG